MIFSGSMVALVTPFKGGEIDYPALASLIEWQIEEGTSAIVVSGTTGESATLSLKEKQELFRFTVERVAHRIGVVAGTGTNNTRETLELSLFAEEVGVDALLLVSPYYNKPSAEGLYAHYATITSQVKCSIILYNVPARTSQNIPLEVLTRLNTFKNVVAIKEATTDLNRITEIRMKTTLKILSGEDSLTLPMISLGAIGVISVVANILPKAMSSLVHEALEGKWEEAMKYHYELYPWCRALFLESNPIPIKYALAALGKIEEEYRLPLCPASLPTRRELDILLELLAVQARHSSLQYV
ncbi:MAG: 4-hydroxy-tetrahydrodipicolinate synthase [Planctomycetota bacterium]